MTTEIVTRVTCIGGPMNGKRWPVRAGAMEMDAPNYPSLDEQLANPRGPFTGVFTKFQYKLIRISGNSQPSITYFFAEDYIGRHELNKFLREGHTATRVDVNGTPI
jgi:hypothetical protein